MKKLTNVLLTGVIILISFILQSTLLRSVSIGGIAPNLMLIITVVFGILAGDYTGIAVGFFSGFLCDLFFGNHLGFYALIFAFIGFLCGKTGRILYIDGLKFPLLITGMGNILFGFYCFIFQFLFRSRMIFRPFFIHFVIPEMIYTLLLTIPLYPLLQLLYRKYMKDIPQSFLEAGKDH